MRFYRCLYDVGTVSIGKVVVPFRLALFDSLQGTTDFHCLFLKVDVRPLEGTEFSDAKSGGKVKEDCHAQTVHSNDRQQPAFFLQGQYTHFILLSAWQCRAVCWIDCDHTIDASLLHCLVEHIVHISQSFRG